MDNRPIGVFDSGLGGLTVVKQLLCYLPEEDILYFGDTGRAPYGTRSDANIQQLARQDIAFLLSRGVKMVVAACGTASANLHKSFTDTLPVPYTGTLYQTALRAAQITKNKRIGVLGTPATIRSGAHEKVIRDYDPSIKIISVGCPLFVPLVEYDILEKDPEIIRRTVALYLKEVREFGADTVILGCTHYPILASYIAAYMGEAVTLIDPGVETALYVRDMLQKNNMKATHKMGTDKYFVSDSPANFSAVAHLFLQREISDRITRINIEEYTL